MHGTPPSRPTTRAGLTALALLLSALPVGCYRYVPARPGSVGPGTEVRIRLTDQGARRLQGFGGPEAGEVRGELLAWGEEVEVSVPVPAAMGMTDRALRNRVLIAEAEVLGVDVRERDRTRTAVLVGGLGAVAATALVAALTGVFGGQGRGHDPGEEEGAVVPVWLTVFP